MPASRSFRPVLIALLGALVVPTLPGCLLLVGSADPSCPNDGVSSEGTVVIGDEERSPVLESVDLDADPTGTCVHGAWITIDFGQGCTMWVQADGPMEEMQVYDVSLFGDEGCGLPEDGFSAESLGASTVSVGGDLLSIGGDDSVCWTGTVEVVLDLVLEEDGVSVPVVGSIAGEGTELAWFEPGNCQ